MEHPATLPLRQIDLPPLSDATISQYNHRSNIPAATAAYLNDKMQPSCRRQFLTWQVNRGNRLIFSVRC